MGISLAWSRGYQIMENKPDVQRQHTVDTDLYSSVHCAGGVGSHVAERWVLVASLRFRCRLRIWPGIPEVYGATRGDFEMDRGQRKSLGPSTALRERRSEDIWALWCITDYQYSSLKDNV